MTDMTRDEQQVLLNAQYKHGTNLAARVSIHERFSINQHGWHRWLFEKLQLPPAAKVLELGCGTAALWRHNAERIPSDWNLTLSDFSSGMVQSAKDELGEFQSRFTWSVIDVMSIPYEDDVFDVVIANHMLYHVPDCAKSLAEIARVLRVSGQLYAATNGLAHMHELDEMICRYVPGVVLDQDAMRFGLENGAQQLAGRFTNILLQRYPDELQVSDVAALLAYLRSMPCIQSAASMDEQRFLADIGDRITRTGAFKITKDVGLFSATVAKA